MRKQGLPLQRLMSHESLTGLADRAALRRTSTPCTPPWARATSPPSTSWRRLVASMGGEEGASEDLAEATTPTARPTRRRTGDPGVVVVGHGRRVGQARPLLHPGARRPDHRLRHPRQRRLGAPRRLHQRRVPAVASRTGSSRSSGRPSSGERLPRAAPGRGARPQPPALRRHPGPLRPARQHPVGVGADLARPGGHLALHLRDGRPGHLDHVMQGGAQDRRRLRRLPDHRHEDRPRPSRRPDGRRSAAELVERRRGPGPATARWAVELACGRPRPSCALPVASALARSASQAGDGRLELVDQGSGAGRDLGVGRLPALRRRPRGRSARRAASPSRSRSMSAARHLAGGVPLVLDAAQRRLGRLEVGDRQDRLGLGEQLLLDGEVGRGTPRPRPRRPRPWPRRRRPGRP